KQKADEAVAQGKNIASAVKIGNIKGILLDLGFSMRQIESSGKGFSFMKNEPLDMRYGKKNNLTAEKIINEYSQKEIEKILREYGE
ncbi:MAG: 16S rRNA (cytosine(1402)-N(4))-methyltransferase, partial [Patescibacteria group bacterium]